MNRKIGKIAVVLAGTLFCSFALMSCDDGSESSGEKSPKTYTIQYTDDNGAHTLTVEEGATYSLESIPTRYGYEFKGLYSMETGGVQYVGANGLSTTAFQGSTDLTLYPQFEAKEYTLVLDYQGAEITGNRSYTVAYGETLLALPTNVSMEAKEFTGWYTEPQRNGTQIADKYGVLPSRNKINEKNFDLSDADGNIFLYAGFQGAIYDVVLHFENGQTEELSVEHDTKISELIYETRVNGKGVIAWSTQENDEDRSHLVSGKIKSDLELYATEYAPVLDFNANGGEGIPSIVAKEGTSVALPTPERENYQFVEWQDKNGCEYTATVMPSDSVELKAIWQAKLIFDENGGTEVVDISKPKGESVSLPETTRSGYIFAGWFVGETEYTSTAMPSESVVLKAGWYEVRTETVVVVNAGEQKNYGQSDLPVLREELTIDCSSFLPADFAGLIDLDFHVELTNYKASLTRLFTFGIYLYESSTISNANLFISKEFVVETNEYRQYSYNEKVFLSGNKIFTATYTPEYCNYGYNYSMTDFYVSITFPDTSKVVL